MSSSLNTHFDKIYALYINNLELFNIKNKLSKKGINATYYPGVLGQNMKNEFSQLKNTNIRTVGAFGHVLSFINIINDAIKHKYKKILILESDIYFSKDFDKIVPFYLNLDYKVLYLGASQYKWLYIDEYDKNARSNGFYKPNNTCGTFAIALDSDIFEDYLNRLNRFECPSDICLFDIHKMYDCYVAYPNIVSCDVSCSNTSESRNQVITSKKFRWIRNYEIEDYYDYKTEINGLYEFSIYLNSSTKEFMGTIEFSQNGSSIIKVQLPDKTLADSKLTGQFSIFIMSTGDNIKITTNNLHLDRITQTYLTKNTFLLKLKKYTKINNPSLKNYYKGLNEKLSSIPSNPTKIRQTLTKQEIPIRKSQPRLIVKS